jgi:hypothetical protein
MPVLFIVGTVLALVVPTLRPTLLVSLATLALLLTCAALDGPVVRYRYPADPLIALLGAGAVTRVVGWVIGRMAGRPREASHPSPRLAAGSPGRAPGGA